MFRRFATLALVALLPLSGCKKKSAGTEATAAAGAQAAAAAATPLPSAAPVAAATPRPALETKADVIVLCYHRFEDRPKDSLAIKPDEFEKQMQTLKDDGFTVIKMQDYLAWRRGELSIPPKSCILTIDDGYRSGYEVAWPILKKFGYPFTMFVYVNYIGSGGKSVSWDDLAEMRDAGVDIQSHTYSHSNLRAPGTGVDAKTKGMVQKDIAELGKEGWLKKEIEGSKKALEERLGIRVNAIAYPFGIHTAEARAMVKAAGYEAAFTVYGQRLGRGGDAEQLGRYAIDSTQPKVFVDAMKMIGGGGGPSAAETSSIGQLAAASMVTQPMDKETVNDPMPMVKANLATMGDLDAKSVRMLISGLGPVPAQFDAATKMISYKVTPALKPGSYTVIISAVANGQKVETRWTFSFDPKAKAADPAGGAAPVANPVGS